MRTIPSTAVLFLLAWATCSLLRGQSLVRYNRDVLPILADQCFVCHGYDEAKREAGLRLDSAEGVMAELASGSRAIVPGDVRKSALLVRIFSDDPDEQMPPHNSGKRLSTAQKDILKRWIEQGANYEPHWAYIRPVRVRPPALRNEKTPPPDSKRTRSAPHPNAIDAFVCDRLAKEGIELSPEADRVTLIRRVTLDLTGLPPSPSEVDAFMNDLRDDAFERLVDRLLASPHFGERWARWWLDLAHYADSDGYLQDFIRPVAWRYRQWVVDAFNVDQPFDQFTVEQLAGDLLPNATISQRLATGFLRNTLSNREGGADLEEYRVHQVVDRTVTVGTTWMALTTGCAQCHDHKFDAISQREFYQLYSFFNRADEVNFDAPLPHEWAAHEAGRQKYVRQRAELIAPLAAEIEKLRADWERHLLHAESRPNEDFAWDRTLELLGLQWGQDLGEGQLEGLHIVKMPLAQRTQDQRDRLLDYFLKSAPAEYSAKFAELKLNDLRTKLEDLAKQQPPVTRAPGMMEFPHRRSTHVHVRGDFRRLGEEVIAGTPTVLPPLDSPGDADRLALARWLVSPEHPLTARVTVNRIWQELFGRGIVATSENFGVRGDRPSHPELLDWLALEFIQQGWGLKAMIRQIVLSKTYRQSSYARPELDKIDPLNTLVARQARLRLSAEILRDSALAVSGLLANTIGGPSVKPLQPDSVSQEGYRNTWEPSRGANRYRRGLYTFIQRTSPFAQFVTFDMPDSSRSCTRRGRSNTPLQALNLLNDPVFLEAAQALAQRVLREVHGNDDERLLYDFQLVLSRPPAAHTHLQQPSEHERLIAYLNQQRTILANEAAASPESPIRTEKDEYAAWVALASVLLNLDEFINRE